MPPDDSTHDDSKKVLHMAVDANRMQYAAAVIAGSRGANSKVMSRARTNRIRHEIIIAPPARLLVGRELHALDADTLQQLQTGLQTVGVAIHHAFDAGLYDEFGAFDTR